MSFARVGYVTFATVMAFGFVAPLIAILVGIVVGSPGDFVGEAYYWSGMVRSLSLSLASVVLCWLAAVPVLLVFPFLRSKTQAAVIVVVIAQLQVGLIPRLYGYLGAFSSSGLFGHLARSVGLASLDDALAYSFAGTCLATHVIYAPFFFLPLLSRMLRVPPERVCAILDLGGSRSIVLRTLLKTDLNRTALQASGIYAILVFSDFACSDLVGGGRTDAFGKTLYQSVVVFQDYWGASVVAVLAAVVVLGGARIILKPSWRRGHTQ